VRRTTARKTTARTARATAARRTPAARKPAARRTTVRKTGARKMARRTTPVARKRRTPEVSAPELLHTERPQDEGQRSELTHREDIPPEQT
jgi:hypothetical protein